MIVVGGGTAPEGERPEEDDVLTDSLLGLTAPRPQPKAELEVSPGHHLPGEVSDLQESEVPALSHSAHTGQDLLGGGGCDKLLLGSERFRTSVTSEDGESSASEDRRGNGVTLVARVTAAERVLLHDAVDTTRRREEGLHGAPGDTAGQVRGTEAGAGPAVSSSQSDHRAQGVAGVPELTAGLRHWRGTGPSQTTGMLATGRDTLLGRDGSISGLRPRLRLTCIDWKLFSFPRQPP